MCIWYKNDEYKVDYNVSMLATESSLIHDSIFYHNSVYRVVYLVSISESIECLLEPKALYLYGFTASAQLRDSTNNDWLKLIAIDLLGYHSLSH